MKNAVANKTLLISFLTLSLIASFATASPTPQNALPAKRAVKKTAEKRPSKLPTKTAAPRRTFIDFSENDKVASRRDSPLDRALSESESEVTTIRARSIIAAPKGDSAEPMSNFSREAPRKVVTKPATSPAATSATVSVAAPAATPAPPVLVATPAAPYEAVRPVRPFEDFKEFSSPPLVVPKTVVRPLPVETVVVPEPTPAPAPEIATSVANIETTTVKSEPREGFIKSIAPATLTFVRTGYYSAKYRKFDDRMKNEASMLGLGAARGIETSWGSFEARAAVDIYHAMDQSMTIDNIRMMSVRTEVAYWLSHSRVKPGLSLGLGWADYSIRSYRSISGANEDIVTLRTHAKGKAFSIIPATSLRIEVADSDTSQLVVDVQTEFVALLGGESPDAAQGLGLTLGLGWTF